MLLMLEVALLEMQRSLLGEVSSSLRAVTIRVSDNQLHFDAYFDGLIGEDDVESMSCVEGELIAALPQRIEVTYDIHRIDLPVMVPKHDVFVYMRRE